MLKDEGNRVRNVVRGGMETLFRHQDIVRRQVRAPGPVREELARRMGERLADVVRPFARIVNLSLDAGAMGAVLRAQYPQAKVVDMDPLQPWPEEDEKADLLVCLGTLPVVDDVPAFLFRASRLLKPDGLLVAATLGVESFREIRQAFAVAGLGESGHVIPLTDVREVGGLLQRLRFALPVVDRDLITLTSYDFPSLLGQLTAQGARNVSSRRGKGLMTPRQLAAVGEAYARLFRREDGRLPLTLEVIYLHGWTPGDGQPVAAKRGSGKVSLVRILGAEDEGT